MGGNSGKGILLSADAQPNADGVMLDMHKAIQQLEHALALAKASAKQLRQQKQLRQIQIASLF